MSSSDAHDAEWEAQDKGPWVLITCWAVTAASTIVVMARIYVRGWIKRHLQQDDYWIITAMVCGYISTALSTVAKRYGNGKHMSLLDEEEQQGVLLWTTAAFCPGVMSFGLPKLAVVYLLTHLLNPSTMHKWFLWWMGIWCQLTLFATVGVLLGRCTPARSAWDFSVKGTCFDAHILVAYCIYAGAFSAFVDLYLAIYPSAILFTLQMSAKKKIALSVALGIGSASGVVAIYKTTRIPSLASEDFSYDTADLVVWTVIEGSTIIIASSIPILQPLLEKILRRNPFASSGKNSHSTRQRYYEDYSDATSGIELGQRKAKPKPKDDLGLTIVDADNSQEKILQPTNNPAYQAPTGQPQPSGRGSAGPGRKIMRTDVVTVSYDEQGGSNPCATQTQNTSFASTAGPQPRRW